MDTFECSVLEVHSGDNFLALINLGVDGLFKQVRIRLHGVDAPDGYMKKADTEAGIIRQEVKHILFEKNNISKKCKFTLNYVRGTNWIGQLTCDNININEYLRDKGYIWMGAT